MSGEEGAQAGCGGQEEALTRTFKWAEKAEESQASSSAPRVPTARPVSQSQSRGPRGRRGFSPGSRESALTVVRTRLGERPRTHLVPRRLWTPFIVFHVRGDVIKAVLRAGAAPWPGLRFIPRQWGRTRRPPETVGCGRERPSAFIASPRRGDSFIKQRLSLWRCP